MKAIRCSRNSLTPGTKVNGRIRLHRTRRKGMRRTARAHIVLRVDLEEADRLAGGIDRGEMLRLEADAGAAGKY